MRSRDKITWPRHYTPIIILPEYSDYSDIILTDNIAELSEYTGIDDHIIKLKEGKQPPFGPIYSLESVKLETLKTYIQTNLANSFIWSFKSFA